MRVCVFILFSALSACDATWHVTIDKTIVRQVELTK